MKRIILSFIFVLSLFANGAFAQNNKAIEIGANLFNERINTRNICKNIVNAYDKKELFSKSISLQNDLNLSISAEAKYNNSNVSKFSTIPKLLFSELFDTYLAELNNAMFNQKENFPLLNIDQNLSEKFTNCANNLQVALIGTYKLDLIKQNKILNSKEYFYQYLNDIKNKKIKLIEFKQIVNNINNISKNPELLSQITKFNPEFQINDYLGHLKLIETQADGSFYRLRQEKNINSPFECFIEDTGPVVRKSVSIAKIYPEKALKNKLEGGFVVKILVDSYGKVKSVELVSVTDPIFYNEQIENTLKMIEFWPALKNCIPEEHDYTIKSNFKLN